MGLRKNQTGVHTTVVAFENFILKSVMGAPEGDGDAESKISLLPVPTCSDQAYPIPPNSQPHPQPTQQRDHFVIEDCSFLLSSPLDTTMKSCLNLLSKDNRTQRDIAGLHLFLSRPWFD